MLSFDVWADFSATSGQKTVHWLGKLVPEAMLTKSLRTKFVNCTDVRQGKGVGEAEGMPTSPLLCLTRYNCEFPNLVRQLLVNIATDSAFSERSMVIYNLFG